jgi:polyisoprenoid-binding protein YceI
MKTTLLAFLLALQTTLFAQTTWNIDPVHSNVKFAVDHLVITEMEGSFRTFDGSFTSSKPDFTDAKIQFSVDVKSINTENEMRDGHLMGDDFFNAEKYPKMTFKGVQMKKISDKKYELIGNLTIRDITRSVKFDVTYGGTAKDGYGNTKAGFKATSAISRSEFGLKWNSMTEAGGAVVGDQVTIILKLQFNQAK